MERNENAQNQVTTAIVGLTTGKLASDPTR